MCSLRSTFPFATASIALAIVTAGLTACGGKIAPGSESSDAATRETGTPASCNWSPSFDPADAEPMRDSCRAARMVVSCTGTDGSGSICFSDQEKCDGPNPGVMYTCKDLCERTEFAAKCGTIMGSSVLPPGDCRVAITAPGGPYYCCTCSM